MPVTVNGIKKSIYGYRTPKILANEYMAQAWTELQGTWHITQYGLLNSDTQHQHSRLYNKSTKKYPVFDSGYMSFSSWI